MSKYKLSNSIPFGFGAVGSTFSNLPFASFGCKHYFVIIKRDTLKMRNTSIITETSTQFATTDGYFLESHLKKAGTPISQFQSYARSNLQI